MIFTFLNQATDAARDSVSQQLQRLTSKSAVFQVDGGGATAFSVSVQGRVEPSLPWVTLNTVTQATAAASLLFEVVACPLMRVSMTQTIGAGTGVNVFAEVDASPSF
jgi:hypothetical protein